MSKAMMIQFNCSNCMAPLEADERMAGMTLGCPDCGMPVVIPKGGGKREKADRPASSSPPDPRPDPFAGKIKPQLDKKMCALCNTEVGDGVECPKCGHGRFIWSSKK